MPTPLLRLYFWHHRLLMLGPRALMRACTATMPRRSASVCMGVLRLRTDPDRQWAESGSFYVPPDAPHEFAASATSTAILYIEAESAEFATLRRSLKDPVGIARVSATARSLADLRRLADEGGALEEANAVCVCRFSACRRQPPNAQGSTRGSFNAGARLVRASISRCAWQRSLQI